MSIHHPSQWLLWVEMNEWMDGWMDGWMVGWTDGPWQMNRLMTDEYMWIYMYGYKYERQYSITNFDYPHSRTHVHKPKTNLHNNSNNMLSILNSTLNILLTHNKVMVICRDRLTQHNIIPPFNSRPQEHIHNKPTGLNNKLANGSKNWHNMSYIKVFVALKLKSCKVDFCYNFQSTLFPFMFLFQFNMLQLCSCVHIA